MHQPVLVVTRTALLMAPPKKSSTALPTALPTTLPKKKHRLGYALALIASTLLHGCGGGGSDKPLADTQCSAPAGFGISDVQSVVDWLNAMPKPVTLPCFIASLPRPLNLQPAFSEFSAQSSPDLHNPRVFLFFDKLILTVAIDQDFAEAPHPLLEMSYLLDEQNLITTKAELKFPILDSLLPATPYTGLSFNDRISQCSFCHPDESVFSRLNDIPIYQSAMLKPTHPLPINQLYQERSTCGADENLHRCAMLSSIVDHGELILSQFPARARTIFDN